MFYAHNNTVNIDHHISNEHFAKINCVINTASCCEIILSMLRRWGAELTRDMAICLYSGLSSDTGNFAHSNTSPETFEAAAVLARVVGDVNRITARLFKEITADKVRLMATAFSSMTIHCGGKLSVFFITYDALQKSGSPAHETEGVVDYAVNIDGVEVGVIMLESERGKFKVSLRSKHADVSKIAAEFGGGGHMHASGCMLFGSPDEVLSKLVKTVAFYVE